MNSIRNIARLNELELEKCTPPNASWHTDYRDTAYIHIGGLPFELSEGDVMLIFSQYGNPKHINLVRDKDTGKSRGFAFLKYEDQRSTDLAVDNLSGAQVLGRTLTVDHARYKLKEGERETVGDTEEELSDAEDERDGERRRKRRRRSESESESEQERPMLPEEVELAKLMREHDDDDPMKAYLVKEKKAEVEEALAKMVVSKPKQKDGDRERRHRHRHTHRSHRDGTREDDDDGKENGHPRRRMDAFDEGESRSKGSHRSSRRERSPTVSPEPERFGRKRSSRDEEDERGDDRRRRRRRSNDFSDG